MASTLDYRGGGDAVGGANFDVMHDDGALQIDDVSDFTPAAPPVEAPLAPVDAPVADPEPEPSPEPAVEEKPSVTRAPEPEPDVPPPTPRAALGTATNVAVESGGRVARPAAVERRTIEVQTDPIDDLDRYCVDVGTPAARPASARAEVSPASRPSVDNASLDFGTPPHPARALQGRARPRNPRATFVPALPPRPRAATRAPRPAPPRPPTPPKAVVARDTCPGSPAPPPGPARRPGRPPRRSAR